MFLIYVSVKLQFDKFLLCQFRLGQISFCLLQSALLHIPDKFLHHGTCKESEVTCY